MCGIVGAIAERNVTPILLEGLRRLEYRGYDSAGIVTVDSRDDRLHRVRTVGKVQALTDRLQQESVRGPLGLAHTRWATTWDFSTATRRSRIDTIIVSL